MSTTPVRPETRPAGAADLFLLDDPARRTLVAAGTVDLFLLAIPADGLPPRRRYLTRITQGGVLFGFPEIAGGIQVQAVPGNGAALADLAPDTVQPTHVIAWLKALTPNPDPPETPAWLDEGAKPNPGDAVSARAPSWATAPPGTLRLPDGTPAPPSGLPLLPETWARLAPAPNTDPNTETAPNAIRLTPIATWWSTPSAEADLAAWQRTLLESARRRALEAWQAERTRLGEREAASRARIGRLVQDLAQVALRERSTPTPSPLRILAVAEAVANATGLKLRLPPGGAAALGHSKTPVEDLAAASRIPVRRVALPIKWWKQDFGPLIGFDTEGAALALLPGPNGYHALSPGAGPAHRVDHASARTIAPHAYSFVQNLPDHALSLRDIARFCQLGNTADLGTVAVMVLLAGLAGLAPPLATRLAIGAVIPAADTPQALVLGAVMLAAGIAVALFQAVQAIAILRIEGRIDLRLQPAIWDRLLKLPATFFRQNGVGDLVSRAQTIDGIRRVLTGGVVTSIIGIVTGCFSLALMLYYQWKLGLVLTLMALTVAGLGFWIGRSIVSADRQQLILGGQLQGKALQLIAALPKLRVAGTEIVGLAIWTRLFRQRQELVNRVGTLNILSQTMMGVFPGLALATIVGMLGLMSGQLLAYFRMPSTWNEILARDLTTVMPTADFSAFLTAYVTFSTAVLGLVGIGVQLAVLKPMIERIRPILETPTEFDNAEQDPGTLEGRIACRAVTFRYTPDAPPSLDRLDLAIEPGQLVGLCGPSGGGRSTLVRLLLGFETAQSGTVLIDGRDVRTLDKQRLRRQLGVVLQQGKLIAGSLRENICAGTPYPDDEIWAAARAAGFDTDIDTMPQKLETPISPDAETISGGQRQRLMIARALIRKPRMIIFDEATSALDNRTQQRVLETLAALPITRIVIAHRLGTIKGADCIHVIDAGRIVESGTYDTLIARNGLFADLARRQSA